MIEIYNQTLRVQFSGVASNACLRAITSAKYNLTRRSAAPGPFKLECKEESCWNMCPGFSSALSSDIKCVEYPLLLALDSMASAEPPLSATNIKY